MRKAMGSSLGRALCALCLVIALCAPAAAVDWPPNIGDMVYSATEKNYYREDVKTLHAVGDAYDNVANANGTIVHDDEGILMDNVKYNHSWSYYFELPEEARQYTRWRVELDVLRIEGGNWAGVMIENYNIGYALRVNRFGKGQLVLLRTDVTTNVIDEFFLPKEMRPIGDRSVTLCLEYDVNTSELVARVDNTVVHRKTLPADGMPAISAPVGFSMEGTNPWRSTIGTVRFGDMIVRCGN